MKISKTIVSSLLVASLSTGCFDSSGTGSLEGYTDLSGSIVKNTTFQGVAVDGYLVGSTVCLDINANSACDSDEPQTTTDDDGDYSFKVIGDDYDSIDDDTRIVIVGGTDASTNESFTGTLKAPLIKDDDGKTNVTTLTTLIAEQATSNSLSEVEEIASDLATSLGISDIDELFQDPIVLASNGNKNALIAVQQIQQSIELIANLGNTTFSTVAKELAASFVALGQNGNSSGIDGALDHMSTTTTINNFSAAKVSAQTLSAQINTTLASATTLEEFKNAQISFEATRTTYASNSFPKLQASGIQVDAASVTSIVLYNGVLYGAGHNDYYEAGYMGSTADVTSFTQIDTNVKQFATADGFGAYLKNDGTVWGYGYLNGTIALNTLNQIYITDVVKIYAYYGSLYFQKDDGSIWANGYNGYNRLGLDASVHTYSNLQNTSLTDIVDIRGYKDNNTLFLKGDGTVWGVGQNANGELGLGHNSTVSTLTQIPITNVISIAEGESHSLFVKSDGSVWGCGLNSNGELGLGNSIKTMTPTEITTLTGKNIVHVTAGYRHSYFRDSDGNIYAAGYNWNGQQGIGTYQTASSITAHQITTLSNVTDMATGVYHSIFVKNDGTIYGLGTNTYGNLGFGNTTAAYVPTQAMTIQQTSGNFSATDADGDTLTYSATALHGTVTVSGTSWSYTPNSGYTGSDTITYSVNDGNGGITTSTLQIVTYSDTSSNGSSNNSPVAFDFNFNHLASSENHTFFLKSDGTVLSTGYNVDGELGIGTATDQNSPTTAGSLSNIQKIASGSYHTLFLDTDGNIWSTGYNNRGQLGLGTTTNQITPTKIASISNIVDISAGQYHSIALKTDGTVWATGYNTDGQLGLGDLSSRTSPTQISSLTNVKKIFSSYNSSFFIKNDGTIWATGDNFYGQLGVGDNNDRTTPTQITSLSNVTAIAVGTYHTLFLKSDGTVYATGLNSSGQLGLGDTTNKNTPTQITSLSNIIDVKAGLNHSLFLTSSETVWSCGDNIYGQLGFNDPANDTLTPTVLALNNIVEIVSGANHSLFVKSDGKVYSTGRNNYGQLGTGNTADIFLPVQISTLLFTTPSSGLLVANDADNDTLTYSGTANNGTVTLSNNTWIYTPNSGFSGEETITYTVSDGNGGSDIGTITFYVYSSYTGTLDTTFGTSGIKSFNAAYAANTFDEGASVLVLSDGSYYVVGTADNMSNIKDIYITKYNADDTIDTTYSGYGGYIYANSQYNTYVKKAVLDNNGDIVIIGATYVNSTYSYPAMLIAKFDTTNLQFDTTFTGDASYDGITGFGSTLGTCITTPDPSMCNANGLLFYVSGSNLTEIATDVEITSDNKIVVTASSSGNTFLMKLNNDGTTDTNFMVGNTVGNNPAIIDIGAYTDYNPQIALDSSNNIYLVNTLTSTSNYHGMYGIARIASDGTYQTITNTNYTWYSMDIGRSAFYLPNQDYIDELYINDIALSNDTIYLVGRYYLNTDADYYRLAIKLSNDGAGNIDLDSTFAGGGVYTDKIGVNTGFLEAFTAVEIDSSSDLILSGFSYQYVGATAYQVLNLAKIAGNNGVFDNSFGGTLLNSTYSLSPMIYGNPSLTINSSTQSIYLVGATNGGSASQSDNNSILLKYK